MKLSGLFNPLINLIMRDIKFSSQMPCFIEHVRNGIFKSGKILYCRYNDLFGAITYMKIGKIK